MPVTTTKLRPSDAARLVCRAILHDQGTLADRSLNLFGFEPPDGLAVTEVGPYKFAPLLDLARYAFYGTVRRAEDEADTPTEDRDDLIVLGRCAHGVDLDREFCPHGCRV